MFQSTCNLVSRRDRTLSVCCLHFPEHSTRAVVIPTSHLLTHIWCKTSLKDIISVWRFWLSEHCSSHCTVQTVNYATTFPQRSFSTLETDKLAGSITGLCWSSNHTEALLESMKFKYKIQILKISPWTNSNTLEVNLSRILQISDQFFTNNWNTSAKKIISKEQNTLRDNRRLCSQTGLLEVRAYFNDGYQTGTIFEKN